ncbi:MAG: hypothetical protein QOG85_858 [Gaiellaceae bacterium]|nr:hypothetical protein [Gaiellaceae bacterium]
MSLRSAVLFSAIAVVVAFVAMSILGCGLFPKVPDERAIARGAVLATAEAVKAADVACAQYGTATEDLELLQSCAHHYDAARIALIATGSAVDLWDRAETRGSVACALARALAELEQLTQDLAARGTRPPSIIEDARALAATLGGCPDV